MDALEARVVEEVASRRDELVALVATLVGFDTTAGEPAGPAREEAALQAFLAGRLRAAGLAVELVGTDPERLRGSRQLPPGFAADGRDQLVARAPGRGGGQSLLLCGHIDVVSAEPRERWSSDPFDADVRDGRLYGRGACDMKGGVAAMVLAAEVLRALEVGLAGDLVLATVTDEESTGAGALATVAHGVRADAGLVPEPTSLDVWVGARGSLLATIMVEGRPGHAGLAQPHHSAGGAVNAVEKLGVVLDALRRLQEEWRLRPDGRHAHLAPAAIVPTSVAAGEWVVTHPAQATLCCHVTYLPAQADEAGWGTLVEQELEACVAAAARTDSWLAERPPRVTWSVDVPAFCVDSAHPVVRTARESAVAVGPWGGGIAERTTWFDGATFTRAGTPTVGFGPGDIAVAHAVDEHVEIDELVRAAQGLALAAMRFCGVSRV